MSKKISGVGIKILNHLKHSLTSELSVVPDGLECADRQEYLQDGRRADGKESINWVADIVVRKVNADLLLGENMAVINLTRR